MTQVEESFQGLPIRRVLQKPVEPIGLQRLSEMAADMFDATVDPMATTGTPIGMEVSGSDGWYRLALPLPLAERGDIALSRSGADLVVTVGDVRRRIALPSVLQRCSTEGASFEQRPADDRLRRRSGSLAGRPGPRAAGRCRVSDRPPPEPPARRRPPRSGRSRWRRRCCWTSSPIA